MQVRVSVSGEGVRVQHDGEAAAQQAREALRENLRTELQRATEHLREVARTGDRAGRAELDGARADVMRIAQQLQQLEVDERTAQAMQHAFDGVPPRSAEAPRAIAVQPPGDDIPDIPPRVADVSMLFFVCVAAMVILTPIMRAIGRRLDRSTAAPARALPEFDARLARMEQAIEAVAIEVERVAEGQRFATRLLAQREGVPLDR